MQWLFYAIAFSGVLLIERFDASCFAFYLALGIFRRFVPAWRTISYAASADKEHPLTVVLHFQFVAVLGLISLFFEWGTPSGWDWLYLFLIGVFSQLGQIFLTNALQKERVAGVAIVNYTGLIYALLIGSFVFLEPQTAESMSGMLLVVFGVMLSVIYSRRMRDLETIEATAA